MIATPLHALQRTDHLSRWVLRTSQAAFYLTRPVTIVKVEDYSANTGKKKGCACKD